VGEGVETYEQLEQLRQFNGDEIQGYIFSKPLSPAKAGALLKSSISEPCFPLTNGALPTPLDEGDEETGLRISN